MILIKRLTLVEETRSDINRKHDRGDVLFFIIRALMNAAEGWSNIETDGGSKTNWLRQYDFFAKNIHRRHAIARILRRIVIDTLRRLYYVGLMTSASGAI